MKYTTIMFVMACAGMSTVGAVQAAVTADEAKQLSGSLTPLGAEKAGNQAGTIPAWDGGLKGGAPATGRRPDPYAAEKPLFTISAKNLDQYAEQLTDGVKAMLKKYPSSYRLDVYPTHRTAAAPQYVYDNTLKNATRGKLVQSSAGQVPEGVFGGVPFPIPKSGLEIMWNHLLRWRGESVRIEGQQWLTTADGKQVLTNDATVLQNMPYYYKDTSLDKFKQEYWQVRVNTVAPSIKVGEAIVGRENLNADRTQVWVYLPGQRRVRKLPNSCCDTPTPQSSGLMSFDETQGWSGRLDRYDWKIVGKKEIFIPYNTNRLLQPNKHEVVLGQHHLNPDYVRWELHRVWVLEGTVAQGKRHVSPRSRYYIDEDTWSIVLTDRWDGNNQLWKTNWTMPVAMPDLAGTVTTTFGYYDLLSGAWYANDLMNEKSIQYKLMPHMDDDIFTPDAMAGEGVR